MKVCSDPFNPGYRHKVKDNFNRDERQSLCKLSQCNRDGESPWIIRVEDKGSNFVVDWKDNYLQKALRFWTPRSLLRQN